MNGKVKFGLALVLGVLFAGTLAVMCLPKTVATGNGEGAISLSVDKNYYERGQGVSFTLTNTGNVELMDTPSLTIHKKDGAFVAAVTTLTVLYTLQPTQSISFHWDQKDGNGKQVADDQYVVKAKFAGKFALSSFKIGVGSTKTIYTLTVMNSTAHRAEIYVWNSGATTITGYFHFYVYNSNGDVVYAYSTSKKYSLSPGSYGVHHWALNSNTGQSVGDGDYYIVCAVTNPSYKSHHAISHELFHL
ncbi:MAG: hypothetical protein N3F63_07230 [Thermoplasmata archaeon]|nr:hypothetical protein [Thermoplasmata archaeon]